VQVGDDPRQNRSDDGLVEGAQEEAEQDGPQDLELCARGQAQRRVLLEANRAGRPLVHGDVFHEM